MPELVEYLSEQRLAEDYAQAEVKPTKILVADPRGELIARRIVQSQPSASDTLNPLYGMFEVEFDATLPLGTWELA